MLADVLELLIPPGSRADQPRLTGLNAGGFRARAHRAATFSVSTRIISKSPAQYAGALADANGSLMKLPPPAGVL
jgi:hypothetical protein